MITDQSFLDVFKVLFTDRPFPIQNQLVESLPPTTRRNKPAFKLCTALLYIYISELGLGKDNNKGLLKAYNISDRLGL